MVKFQVVRVSCIAVLIMSILVGVPEANAASAITCEQVTIWLTPCIGYGVLGGVVPDACCSGIKALNAASKTAEDRRTQCQCVKEGAARIPGLNYDRVNTLPDICGSACPYKLSPTLDCSKLN
ncbi:non-specific lipid-transfer protein 1-like isoform X1 [Tripterygium wilfordii]|uniref:Non-specific lipid-transfer protein n=1 Tax=Tripterygium wilfordii TaxID=458696 RepID=A0A7J7DEE4_TRIWF|nr:non-specific lipid-transfer protein 1-like [Tripterygium wilfordii]KAF5744446.1 non-specific lipid-transfer protein 1-like isoform X1 [Tripterygium wilfordii]